MKGDFAAASISLLALEQDVKEATTTMTSIPLPLKFLNPFYAQLNEFYDGIAAPN